MQINNTTITVLQADITMLTVDAIVNAANNVGHMGGGVAGVIRKKGGQCIEEEALSKGPFEIGGAIYTTAGDLSAQYVIHAATMGMDFKTDEHKIRNSCRSALEVAQELKVTSMAFPALGCGVGGFSLSGAVRIMIQETLKFLKNTETSLQEVIFCFYDEESFTYADKTIRGYLRHIIEDLGPEPYVTVDVIIEMPEGIILIERSNPPYGWALPGGFLDPGESLEQAAIREAKEETNMDLENLRQFHTYSDPSRDPRFHTISTVFVATGIGQPQFGDDAKGLKVVPYEQLNGLDCAFDHGEIIGEYLQSRG